MGKQLLLAATAAALCLLASGTRAADFTVINTNNAGPGSLRQAIMDANATVERDRVRFDIPGEGRLVIGVLTPLPVITNAIEIDGYTQPGSRPNTERNFDNAVRRVEIDGERVVTVALVLRASDCVVRGLAVRGFLGEAVTLSGTNNVVIGNHLGTDDAPNLVVSTNNRFGNGRGILLDGRSFTFGTHIGGTNRGDRNVIAGNSGNAIRIEPFPNEVGETTIQGNFLGVESSGNRPSVNFGNSTISVYDTRGLWIGGEEDGAGNVILSTIAGVTFHGRLRSGAIVGNYIGVGTDGHAPLPFSRYGINFEAAGTELEPESFVDCLVMSNRIAHCHRAIQIADGLVFLEPVPRGVGGVTISMNSVYANTNSYFSATGTLIEPAAIYMGEPAKTNDFLDLDLGGNRRQNYPELTSATFGENTTIAGVLNSAAFSTYRIEFFANTVTHPSGFGEGEVYLGFTNVTTGVNGAAAYEVTFLGVLATKPYLTATATDADGNTSIFSRPVHGLSPDKPLFHLHPVSATVLPYTNLPFTTDVTGAAPLSLQWTKDGEPIAGATNLSLSLSNVGWEDRGSYVLVASNGFGVVSSETAEVTVLPEPVILVQPAGALVNPGTNFTFSVQAGGMLPIAYQWLWNGVVIPNATGASLTLTNVDWPMRGVYSVVLSSAFGVTHSDLVTLAVRVRPTIIQQPLSQAVVSNGFVTLSVAISNSATAPLTYLWRSNTSVVRVESTTNYVATIDVGPVRANGAYTVQVTNAFSVAGVLSSRVNLTVLADTDGDGLPDEYESAYGLNSSDASDAALDGDGDGVSNIDEYRAGTDPTDSANQLRVERIGSDGGVTWLEFQTRSNRTYVVERRPAMGQGAWLSWITVPARSTNGLDRLRDSAPSARKFYRLRTPAGD